MNKWIWLGFSAADRCPRAPAAARAWSCGGHFEIFQKMFQIFEIFQKFSPSASHPPLAAPVPPPPCRDIPALLPASGAWDAYLRGFTHPVDSHVYAHNDTTVRILQSYAGMGSITNPFLGILIWGLALFPYIYVYIIPCRVYN